MKKLFASALLSVASVSGAATFTVTNTNDSGAGSLRQAIDDANNTPGADTIVFNIPGPGVHTITPLSLLPIIFNDVTIDGYTQPGSSVNTNATGALNTVLQIEIDGTSAPNRCITILGNSVTIRGLVVNRCQDAIQIGSGTPITITGNFLGTDPSGMTISPNNAGVNVGTQLSTATVLIGGPNPEDRNLISGNSYAGISLGGNFNGNNFPTILGNVIGLDREAAAAIPNQRGIIVGGLAPAHGFVGGVAPGEGNLIAGNVEAGVSVGDSVNRIAIRGNSIHGNGGLGISLGSSFASPQPNDEGDADGGGNNRQNFPIVRLESSVAEGGSTHMVGVLRSAPSTLYVLDFYANPPCSNFPREFLEGETYLGSGEVTTDATGFAEIDLDVVGVPEPGARITATATDPDDRTSEFSQRIPFSMTPSSGPAAGGLTLFLTGTDILDGASVTVGTVPATNVIVTSFNSLMAEVPGLPPGGVHDVVVTNTDGTAGTLVKGWVSDFLDVPQVHQFYSFVTKLVSNGITVGVGGGNYGPTQDTLRQQMAVFLLRSKYGLCFAPPPCTTQVFDDVPCSSIFAPWINELVAQNITGGCGGNNYCPTNAVLRQQMAVLLLRTLEGDAYTPPACTVESFSDVPCSSIFAPWIYELVARGITAGCGSGLYCPTLAANRGQMATFVVKTFNLQ
jgi:hypothetical protein